MHVTLRKEAVVKKSIFATWNNAKSSLYDIGRGYCTSIDIDVLKNLFD